MEGAEDDLADLAGHDVEDEEDHDQYQEQHRHQDVPVPAPDEEDEGLGFSKGSGSFRPFSTGCLSASSAVSSSNCASTFP